MNGCILNGTWGNCLDVQMAGVFVECTNFLAWQLESVACIISAFFGI